MKLTTAVVLGVVAAVPVLGCGSGEVPRASLAISARSLPAATVGSDYKTGGVSLQATGGRGALAWSISTGPAALAWLGIESGSGVLGGVPLDIGKAQPFTVRVTDGIETATRDFSLDVVCKEGVRSACGVPDPGDALCLAGSRVCSAGVLGACQQDTGKVPYTADTAHCGGTCSEVCSRQSANRCVGACACGAGPACSGTTPACCPAPDGAPEQAGCVSLDTTAHCGSCGNACASPPNTAPACATGTCTYACQPGYLSCNTTTPNSASDADGCEIHADVDLAHCGSCTKSCSAIAPLHTVVSACTAGTCQYTCATGFANCTGATCSTRTDETDANGCETPISTLASCGLSRTACGTPTDGTSQCVPSGDANLYRCTSACNPGRDPDPCPDAANPAGACKLLGDPANCGRCGASCPTIMNEELMQSCTTQGFCCAKTCTPGDKPPCQPEECRRL